VPYVDVMFWSNRHCLLTTSRQQLAAQFLVQYLELSFQAKNIEFGTRRLAPYGDHLALTMMHNTSTLHSQQVLHSTQFLNTENVDLGTFAE
jgi:hypothetical protein